MINIHRPENQKLAIDVIEREGRKCRVCGKPFSRFYIGNPEPGDERAGIVRVEAHCGTAGDNLHVFKVWPHEIKIESDEQALTSILAGLAVDGIR